MPVHLYWGEDAYRRGQAVEQLRAAVVDPAWEAFNFGRYAGEALIDALNQAASAPFGGGGRLVWVEEARIFSHCPEGELAELARTLPHLHPNGHLLFTLQGKPDGRLKSTKLVAKVGEVREFSLISLWQEAKLKAQVQQMAQERKVTLSAPALQLLTEAVGNDARRLDNELEKLALFAQGRSVDAEAVGALVATTAHTSFQLAAALLAGEAATALRVLDELLRRNEPALRIQAVLVNQFRTWLWVRVLIEAGERDAQAIAAAAEIANPGRVYFLQKEVERTSALRLGRVLPILLGLEVALKGGRPERAALESAVLHIVNALR
ncbi:MAG: DNA polymerase III subunit delta [Aphanocapsa lilacina HA4352-LM1]|jgi:DNA polymerase-3 subunit delta|nr:DNA polymerase III subunit delta [Aphanocapsa lilacina HA4352-LM1]